MAADDLCICGHRRDEHEQDGDTILCYGPDENMEATCDCDEFEMDYEVPDAR